MKDELTCSTRTGIILIVKRSAHLLDVVRQAQLECGYGRRHDHLPERRDAHSLAVDDADERGIRGGSVRRRAGVAAVHRHTELDGLEGQVVRRLSPVYHVVKS